ncbi:hypothetical protein L596_014236 [Steinernema carpocapsae]|uniref:F5/8 type C domain-containing protein n=1 Tax=Steinernema carpocapsae TaxID=34508 RepID=A0A4U5NB79_STECR|nr:hypothetical protein L596_014236 [Steinernema carpocapsae]
MLRLFFLFCLLASRSGLALDLKECNRPLGMESGRIPASKISASSSFDEESTGPQHARIRTETGSGAWCPLNQINATSSEWLQIELPVDTVISAIETQGRFDNGRGMEYPPAFLLEFWRPSLGRWARYRDRHNNEIIEGNSDTRSAVLRVLDGGVVAKTLRIMPVSEVTRTVCMRVEVYGCTYRGPLKTYNMFDGTVADGLDLRDSSYDGSARVGRYLHGGLGKLYDGVTGEDNFEKHPHKWIGWRREGPSASVVINIEFTSRRNISSVSLHTSNFNRYGAAVFDKAVLSFRPAVTSRFSPRIIEFEYVADKNFETARWVRIPVPDRLAVEMRIELFFASGAEWLLVSEMRFESTKTAFGPMYTDPLDEEIQIEQRVNSNSLTYFAVGDASEDYSRWISLGVIAALSSDSLPSAFSSTSSAAAESRAKNSPRRSSRSRPEFSCS